MKIGCQQYLHKKFKELHPELQMSTQTMQLIEQYLGNVFDRIVRAAADAARTNNKRTITDREIQLATKLVFNDALALRLDWIFIC